MNIEGSSHPVLAAGTIVDRGAVKVDVAGAETPAGLRKHGLLTNPNGLVYAERVTVSPVVIAVTIVGPVLAIGPITGGIAVVTLVAILITGLIRSGTLLAILIIGLTGAALVIRNGTARVQARHARTPSDIEGISFEASLLVFNLHHGAAAIPGSARQCLVAAAIHSRKAKVSGISRHGAGAFESTPLCRLSRKSA